MIYTENILRIIIIIIITIWASQNLNKHPLNWRVIFIIIIIIIIVRCDILLHYFKVFLLII